MVFGDIQLAQTVGQVSQRVVVAVRFRIVLLQFLPHYTGIDPGTHLPEPAKSLTQRLLAQELPQ